MKTRIAPVVLLLVALGGLVRFMPGVPLVQVVGLFASGALAGVSFARLVMTSRRG